MSFLAYAAFSFVPADGTAYTIDGGLIIPSIGLTSGVTKLELHDHKLDTPDSIVGSYSQNTNKTFLIGHSSTIFKNLYQVKIGETITYNNTDYTITSMEIFKKSDIDMKDVLKAEEKDTLVIMTCAGEVMNETDATHRLIVTAIRN
ncbi:class F sortase [Candidatus Saccharibacteria bacterium]|nr:class F sortase [Candidatus Saccharibacteria bacterium]